ncbi:hypothetical protein [Nonomuraea basaltis]|uniref:hypothetical protein n=1 Tax=Nonomuraea basaltis TaxID=2495887 RepID=UPI00110C673F|nr:hypothetical protein [Nonomuraea basaltis]TMR89162.1 hypothetical protein EJK15_62150 [Nonomuraea basaltis]
MQSTPRRIAAVAVIAGGLTLFAAPTSHAVVDPMQATACLTESAAGITSLVDPMAPGVPAEVPAVHCLTGP